MKLIPKIFNSVWYIKYFEGLVLGKLLPPQTQPVINSISHIGVTNSIDDEI